MTLLIWSIVTLGEIFRCYPPYLTIPPFILTSFAAVSPQPSPEWAIWVIEAITQDGWSPYQDFSSVSRIFSFYLGAWVPVGGSQEFTLWLLLCCFGITFDQHSHAKHRVTPFAVGLVVWFILITKWYFITLRVCKHVLVAIGYTPKTPLLCQKPLQELCQETFTVMDY